MTLLPSSEEMAAMDRYTMEQRKVPSLVLMERAGRGCAVELLKLIQRNAACFSKRRTCVLCGPGNNGGDGFVLARELVRRGERVDLIVIASSRYSDDCTTNAERLRQLSGRVYLFGDKDEIPAPFSDFSRLDLDGVHRILPRADCVVDSLLGNGQDEAPRGAIAELLRALPNPLPGLAVAIDLPTGVNATSGERYEPFFSADVSLAIQLPKRGMYQPPARASCGEIRAISIGIEGPPNGSIPFRLLGAEQCRFPASRELGSHKGDFGAVLVIGGSLRMPGAPTLAAEAALRLGSGRVTKLAFPEQAHPEGAEVMSIRVSATEEGTLGLKGAQDLLRNLSQYSVFIAGPGLGESPETGSALRNLLMEIGRIGAPVVVDADGLRLLGEAGEFDLPEHSVLTPHPGEAGSLLGVSAKEVQSDRYGAALELSRKTTAVVVLKGASTIVMHQGEGWVNDTGNPWLACGGTGDVLAGMIASFIGQGLSPFEASRSAVWLHGAAADLLVQQEQHPFLASEIPSAAAELLRDYVR